MAARVKLAPRGAPRDPVAGSHPWRGKAKLRIWSIHPRYLDPQGLVALWREGLLAQKVLLGQTRGYRAHPQLVRFAACPEPVRTIGAYLAAVADEAAVRGYSFDRSRLAEPCAAEPLPVRSGQIAYEWEHLLRKLAARSPERFELHRGTVEPEPHPLFRIVPGGVEAWERPAPPGG